MISFNKAKRQSTWLDIILKEPEYFGEPYVLEFEKEVVLDVTNFEVLNDVLGDRMNEGVRKLVVDMGNVSRMTANALAVLTAKNEEFKAKGGEIVLANLTLLMENFLRELHFDTIFRIFGSVEEAMDLF